MEQLTWIKILVVVSTIWLTVGVLLYAHMKNQMDGDAPLDPYDDEEE